jgi:hypothetical protein
MSKFSTARRQPPPRHPDAEGGPKYVVRWQSEFDEFDNAYMTPQQAGVEALRLMQEGDVYAHVIDCDTDRQWDMRVRDHELEVIEVRSTHWDEARQELVPDPIRKWDAILKAYVPVEE